MSFKIGDIIELKDRIGELAPAGAKGTVRRITPEFLYIEWVDSRVLRSQGVYFKWRFKLVVKPGEQLEFSFMEEV